MLKLAGQAGARSPAALVLPGADRNIHRMGL